MWENCKLCFLRRCSAKLSTLSLLVWMNETWLQKRYNPVVFQFVIPCVCIVCTKNYAKRIIRVSMLYKSLVQICSGSGYWTFISFSSPAHNANPFRTASATCGHNSEHCENQWEKHWYLLSISLAVLFWQMRGEKLCMNWTFCVLAVMHYILNKKDFCFEVEFTSWHI